MDKKDALDILLRCKVEVGANFFALRSVNVCSLIREANRVNYRAPKHANGSRGRYFHDFVQRRAAPRKKV
jgi:hypothetical protein